MDTHDPPYSNAIDQVISKKELGGFHWSIICHNVLCLCDHVFYTLGILKSLQYLPSLAVSSDTDTNLPKSTDSTTTRTQNCRNRYLYEGSGIDTANFGIYRTFS
ncbi:phosphatidate cytidylyltransferase [Iris pallida]|uniref:Phosphatidate cytidylyltransferase n=1 Tax=Iris pallida TaxID=29817 RepID=A0AAX6H5C7_IRIPA|nr:phosphatidate cytidylyltransferase [Iris pallida]